MATAPAPAPDNPSDTAPPARRRYWQLPVFAVGVVAAVCSWRAFPPTTATAGETLDRQLTTLRQALDKKADWKQVEAALADLPPVTDRAAGDPRTLYLIGSGHVLLAERGPVGGANEQWDQAHRCFTRVDPTAVAGADRDRLRFRAAKAAAAVGAGDPAAVIAALEAIPPGEEPANDPGERPRLIAETALRMTPPDTRRAKDGLTAYLTGQAPSRLPPATLAKYTIQLSGLCAAAGESEKARTWLGKVGPSAPAELQATAKLQLARMATADRDGNEAVKVLQSADQLPGVSDELRTVIRHDAGVSLLGAGNPTAAKEYFAKAAAGVGPAGVAARVRLGRLAATDTDARLAVELLEAVAATVHSPAEFVNPHLPLGEAQSAFEAAVAARRSAGDFDAALRLAAAYRSLAGPGRDRELGADIQAAWGEALLPTQGVAARGKLTRAAAELEALAEEKLTPADRANLLKRALNHYRLAGDDKGVSAVLSKLNTLPGAPPDVVADTTLARAEQALAAGRFDEGMKLLNDVSKAGGPAGTRATVRLGLAHIADGKKLLKGKDTHFEGRRKVEFGQDFLTQVAGKTFDTADERLAQQEAVFELGKLQVSPNLPGFLNYPEAETRFRRLLREYPTGPYAEEGGLYLGICLTQLALGAHKNMVPPPDADRKFAEAREQFEKLTAAKSEWVRTHADLRLVHVLLLMKQFDALAQACQALADKYRGAVQELIVLYMLYEGQQQAKRPDLAGPVRERMRKAFAALPDAAFGTEMPEYTKAHWEKWFAAEGR